MYIFFDFTIILDSIILLISVTIVVYYGLLGLRTCLVFYSIVIFLYYISFDLHDLLQGDLGC